jgi:hypothetical protein
MIMDYMINKESLLLLISTMLIAIFGAAAKEVSKLDKKKFEWRDLLTQCFTSAFVGLIVGLLCMHYVIPMTLSLALSGLAGHIGAKTLEILVKLIQNRLLQGVQSTDVTSKTDNNEQ